MNKGLLQQNKMLKNERFHKEKQFKRQNFAGNGSGNIMIGRLAN